MLFKFENYPVIGTSPLACSLHNLDLERFKILTSMGDLVPDVGSEAAVRKKAPTRAAAQGSSSLPSTAPLRSVLIEIPLDIEASDERTEAPTSHFRAATGLYYASADAVFVHPTTGVITRPASASHPLVVAISAAARSCHLPILEAALAQARAQGSLPALIDSLFAGTARLSVNQRIAHARCLKDIIDGDFAPALVLLFDSGLGLDTNISTVSHGHQRYSLTFATYAAANNAVACLQLLCERTPDAEWRQSADGHRRSPCEAARRYGCTEATAYLQPWARQQVSGEPLCDAATAESAADATVRAAVALMLSRATLLPRMSPRGPLTTAPPSAYADAARVAVRGWDTGIRAQVCVILRSADMLLTRLSHGAQRPMHPLEFAVLRGWPSAIEALVECCPGLLAHWFQAGGLLRLEPDAATEAALMRCDNTPSVKALRANWRLREDIKIHNAVLYGEDKLAERGAREYEDLQRKAIDVGMEGFWRTSFPEGIKPAPNALAMRAQMAIPKQLLKSIGSLSLSEIPRTFATAPSEGLFAARSLLSNRSQKDWDAVTGLSSWLVLSAALRAGHYAFAQLCVDHGADVFAMAHAQSGDQTLFSTIDCSDFVTSLMYCYQRPVHSVPLPAEADASVLAADPVLFTPENARAHAAAAAAEEERLLAALLRNPDLLQPSTSSADPTLMRWSAALKPALGARWLWDRMFERDPKRATKFLLQSSDSMYDCATRNVRLRYPRLVRFIAARGVFLRLNHQRSVRLVCHACDVELLWALFAALPPSPEIRESLLKRVSSRSPYSVLVALARGALRHWAVFPHRLAGELIGHGAPADWDTLSEVIRAMSTPLEGGQDAGSRAETYALASYSHPRAVLRGFLAAVKLSMESAQRK